MATVTRFTGTGASIMPAGWAIPGPLLRRKGGLEIFAAGLISRIMQPQTTRPRRTDLYAPDRVSVTERMARLAERDRRLAADTRTETQKLLGDPPSAQGVLGQRMHQANLAKIISELIDRLRR